MNYREVPTNGHILSRFCKAYASVLPHDLCLSSLFFLNKKIYFLYREIKIYFNPGRNCNLCPIKYKHVHCRLIASYFLFPWRNSAEMSKRSLLFHNWRQHLLYLTMCKYNFLAWEWIEVKCMFIGSICYALWYACTAFLLCMAYLSQWLVGDINIFFVLDYYPTKKKTSFA